MWYFVFATTLEAATLAAEDSGLQSLRRSKIQRSSESDAAHSSLGNNVHEKRLEDAMDRHIEELKKYKADAEAIEREYQEEVKAQLEDELT